MDEDDARQGLPASAPDLSHVITRPEARYQVGFCGNLLASEMNRSIRCPWARRGSSIARTLPLSRRGPSKDAAVGRTLRAWLVIPGRPNEPIRHSRRYFKADGDSQFDPGKPPILPEHLDLGC